MRKGRDGEKKNGKKTGEKKTGKKRKEKENTGENSGHYVIASKRPPERRPLERRMLAPKCNTPSPVFRDHFTILVKKKFDGFPNIIL